MNYDMFFSTLYKKENFTDEDKSSIAESCVILVKYWRNLFSVSFKMRNESDDYDAFRIKEDEIYADLLQKLNNVENPIEFRKYLANQLLTVENLINKVRQDYKAAELNVFQEYHEIEEKVAPLFERMRSILNGEIDTFQLTKILIKWRTRYYDKDAIIGRIVNRMAFLRLKEYLHNNYVLGELKIKLTPKDIKIPSITEKFNNEETINQIVKGFIEYVNMSMPVDSDLHLHEADKDLDEALKNYKAAFNLIPNCCAIEIVDYIARQDLLEEKECGPSSNSKRRTFVNSKRNPVSVPNQLLIILHEIIFSIVAPNPEDRGNDDNNMKREILNSLLRSKIPIESVISLTAYENYKFGLR